MLYNYFYFGSQVAILIPSDSQRHVCVSSASRFESGFDVNLPAGAFTRFLLSTDAYVIVHPQKETFPKLCWACFSKSQELKTPMTKVLPIWLSSSTPRNKMGRHSHRSSSIDNESIRE